MWMALLTFVAQDLPPPTPPRPAVISGPRWLERPSNAYLAQLFPRDALMQGISGRVVLSCGANLDGRLTDCQVQEETTAGFGFADAALRGAMRFRLAVPETAVAVNRVELPLTWSAPPPASQSGDIIPTDTVNDALLCAGIALARQADQPSDQNAANVSRWTNIYRQLTPLSEESQIQQAFVASESEVSERWRLPRACELDIAPDGYVSFDVP